MIRVASAVANSFRSAAYSIIDNNILRLPLLPFTLLYYQPKRKGKKICSFCCAASSSSSPLLEKIFPIHCRNFVDRWDFFWAADAAGNGTTMYSQQPILSLFFCVFIFRIIFFFLLAFFLFICLISDEAIFKASAPILSFFLKRERKMWLKCWLRQLKYFLLSS